MRFVRNNLMGSRQCLLETQGHLMIIESFCGPGQCQQDGALSLASLFLLRVEGDGLNLGQDRIAGIQADPESPRENLVDGRAILKKRNGCLGRRDLSWDVGEFHLHLDCVIGASLVDLYHWNNYLLEADSAVDVALARPWHRHPAE